MNKLFSKDELFWLVSIVTIFLWLGVVFIVVPIYVAFIGNIAQFLVMFFYDEK